MKQFDAEHVIVFDEGVASLSLFYDKACNIHSNQ